MTTETITDRFILRTPRPLTDDERRRVRAAYEAAYPEQAKAWRERAHVNQKMRTRRSEP
jgi:hypothetical protein